MFILTFLLPCSSLIFIASCHRVLILNLEPMNPYPSRERRRRRHHSASDDNKNAASSSGALVPGSSKDGINQERRKENGALGSDKDSSMRKKRVGRRQTPEPGKSFKASISES